MAVIIEDAGGNEEWCVRCAPQQMTDILVQIAKSAAGPTIATFGVGQLMREEIEDCGDWGGLMQMTDERAAVLLRWATQLETYAKLMRSALASRRAVEDGEER